MGLSIKNPEVERMARRLAKRENVSITEAIAKALENELGEKTVTREVKEQRLKAIREIQEKFAKLPIRDNRKADEILGYDDHGLPYL